MGSERPIERGAGFPARESRLPGSAAWAALAALLLFPGCLPPAPQSFPSRTVKPASLSGEVVGSRWHIPWRVLDLNDPSRPPLLVMIADAQTGSVSDISGAVSVEMRGVACQLFHQGKRVAILHAPAVQANQQSRELVATGGVVVTGVGPQSGSRLTADQLVWHADSDEVLASGNVHAVTHAGPNGVLVTTTGPRMVYNTETGKLVQE